jgi:uncharacterized protein
MSKPRHHQLEPMLLDRFWQRARGLLMRQQLLEKDGVLLRPCRSIHTVGMSRKIDVVFVDHEGCVREIFAEVSPCRGVICKSKGEVAALEISSGNAAKLGIAVGDRISFCRGTV